MRNGAGVELPSPSRRRWIRTPQQLAILMAVVQKHTIANNVWRY
jgi:hypothetical protein